MLSIGLMSGTSLDGIDVSLIRTNGEDKLEILANFHQPYEKDFQIELKEFLKSPKDWSEIERKLTILNATAVNNLLEREKCRHQVDIVGYHGQTIIHLPSKHFTWQLGDPNLLAKLIQIDVIGDFRRRDMAYGGQGAPFVPIYHRALVAKEEKPLLVLNIGGVSNLTYIGSDSLSSFDIGPGNALIDDLCLKLFNMQFDDGGKMASLGVVDRKLVDLFLQDEYFKIVPPKSLDRNHFVYLLEKLDNLNAWDQVATISYFTVAAIISSIRTHLPQRGLNILLHFKCSCVLYH